MKQEIQKLSAEIAKLKERNRRVEAGKAWETSWSRKVVLAVLTYLVIVLFFWISKLPEPFLNALVPTFGFLLSTASLPIFKKVWIKYFYQHKQ